LQRSRHLIEMRLDNAILDDQDGAHQVVQSLCHMVQRKRTIDVIALLTQALHQMVRVVATWG